MVAVVFDLLKNKATTKEGKGTYIFHVIVSEYTAVNNTYKIMRQRPQI